MRSVPITLLLALVLYQRSNLDVNGILYAMVSGALASGVGYAIWYTVLPALKNTSAASVQLSVPVIAAVGGVIFLAEPMTLRLLLTSTAILGGIALVIVKK
jgi:drug/metabolite transporter (DMT)-like permease